VTYALDLETTARAFARFPTLPGADRVVDAMRAHPELVGGPGRPDTELMRALDGWFAKGGAEGLICAAGPDGLGVAVKVEDGGTRAQKPALHAFLGRVGHDLPENFARVDLRNAHDDVVGEIVCEQ
jgi:L-asparaginase II